MTEQVAEPTPDDRMATVAALVTRISHGRGGACLRCEFDAVLAAE